MGTTAASIDTCEDRSRFSLLCDKLNIDQPRWKAFKTLDDAIAFCNEVGFPVLVRPSYVLSGAAMRVVLDEENLACFLREAAVVSNKHPVVISKYIENAKEVEMDSVACNGEILNYAISEHVENAGVHSGDATLILPAQKLYVETIRRVKKLSQRIARALNISGPFNIQFMCRQNDVQVIECNLRASRTFPFISKTLNVDFIEQATRVFVGHHVRPATVHLVDLDYVGVKAPMFSFTRLRGSDPVLGVEMRSTGEVACFGTNKYEALLKAMLSTGVKLPTSTVLLSTGPLWAKVEFEHCARVLIEMGFTIYATDGTYNFLLDRDVVGEATRTVEPPKDAQGTVKHPLPRKCGPPACTPGKLLRVAKPLSVESPNALDLIASGEAQLIINVPDSLDSKALTNGYKIRRAAIDVGGNYGQPELFLL
eukprot:GHVT01065438.1.p1 GENE.GHVT01065438.1~~GHVT01065438.1.p1  ORF type:complete len:424 (+),score=61.83 GHVT01065438.1:760-2031(+)